MARYRPTMTASVSSDFPYLPRQQTELAAVLNGSSRWCSHHMIDSVYGHDGFLVEHDKLGPMLQEFFDKVRVESS